MKDRLSFSVRVIVAVKYVKTALTLAAPAGAKLAQPTGFRPTWVTVTADASFWSGPTASATEFGPAVLGSILQVVAPPQARLQVWNPLSNNYAWIDPGAVQAIADPSSEEVAAF